MRRISALLALAAVIVAAIVLFTFRLRLQWLRSHQPDPTPQIKVSESSIAEQGWDWRKRDNISGRIIVSLHAKSFRGTHDPSTYELHDLTLRLYKKDGGSYTFIRSGTALFDERTEQMKSVGPVNIVMNVPADKDGANKDQITNLVQVDTSGIVYQTKTGVADTNDPAQFHFPEGDGQSVGVAYDPNTAELHMKSKVALDWIGHGPVQNKMHIEAGDLVWKQREQKVYLSPWSKLQRQTTTIAGHATVVTLDDGVLQKVESDHAAGDDLRPDKHTHYSADKMTALFDDDGVLVNILGQNNANISSTGKTSRTNITADRADLRFRVLDEQESGKDSADSLLSHVIAEGHAVAESDPVPSAGAALPETHILRSELIDLRMKSDGKDVEEILAPGQARLEFKPNRPEDAYRILDAARLDIKYGEGSYIDQLSAINAATHTDKPKALAVPDKTGKPPGPSLTWSDQLQAKFVAHSNQVAVIEQNGHFRYEQGDRKANAQEAVLEQTINRITLIDKAHVSDQTGSTTADTIVMNQTNGDMDALGHVMSTHAPDRNQKPGTSMLDATQTMQAKADQMETRDNNTSIFYQGSAVMWQGANRISANAIHINRDEQTLQASGNVVSELVDSKSNENASTSQPAVPSAAPVFTVVYAPQLLYRDDVRIAHYDGRVKLVRDSMTVNSDQLNAYLTPKTNDGQDDSSLDHAVADGDVQIHRVMPTGRVRTGSANHGEFFARENKVILNGGKPQVTDSYKGVTRGDQLTYYSDDDRLLVNGKKKALAYTEMRKK